MKKIWEKPNIEKLSVKKITLSGSKGRKESTTLTGSSYRLPKPKR